MTRAEIALTAIVGTVAASLFGPLLLKASDELRSYRPDAFRVDDEVARSIAMGGADNSLPEQLRRHRTGPHPDHIETTVFHPSVNTWGGQQRAV